MPVIGGLEISENERLHLGEALIVYLYRALDKPAKPAYFHVDLLDVLVKSAQDSVRIVFGISWANGTSCLKAFNRRSSLDEHPDAPQTVATRVVASGQNFAQLSEEAIKRIKSMTLQKRRQLEAIAAAIFPDHEAIQGGMKLYEGAKIDSTRPQFLMEGKAQEVVRSDVASAVQKRVNPALTELERDINEAFSDPKLTSDAKEKLAKELEDILIGRLELEQPQISTELLARVMVRSLKKLGEWTGAGIVGDIAAKSAAAAVVMLGVSFFR
jgi:hypothetical protein